MPALRDCAVAGGIERDDLLDRHWLRLLYLDGEVVSDKAGLLDQAAVNLDNLAIAQQPRSGGEGNPHVRLVCLNLKVDRFGVDFGLPQDR